MPINDGPLHVVAKAALQHFEEWVETGKPPPKAPRLEVDARTSEISRDADGIALGGVRTPPVDVPVNVSSSVPGPTPSVICLLLGSTKPMPAGAASPSSTRRAPTTSRRTTQSAEEAIDAGFVLAADRELLDGFAHPELVEG